MAHTEIAGKPEEARVRGVNGAAVAGLVLAVLSIVLWIYAVCPALAILFSVIGLVKARSRGGQGRVLAFVGLGLGAVMLIIGTIMTMAILSAIDDGGDVPELEDPLPSTQCVRVDSRSFRALMGERSIRYNPDRRGTRHGTI